MSFTSSQHPRRRAAQGHGPHRRPLARSNSSLLGTIKNIVTAPLTWLAGSDDFDEAPDLKGKRRRNVTARSPTAMDDSEGPPRPKRLRVQSPDSQIQFHPEPQYAPSYANPPTAYLDPPEMAFTNPPSRSNSVNAPPSTLSQYNATRSLFRTMSIDPPYNPVPVSREPSMNLFSTPFDRDASMERASSAIPRDLSMPLPTTRSPIRLRSSLTPQPSIAREVSEPPSLSILAQKPVFVRTPTESHQRLSSQSSNSTLGSLVDSQRRTRSPMRQHSSLLFGSGTQEQHEAGASTRQPAAAERALHELDVYKTPLLPTRSRLRAGADTGAPSGSGDASDLFRPRRRSELTLMRDERRANRLGHKTELPFLEPEKPKEKEVKKVNETKPYAGEGGMKKLLARRQQEVEEEVAQKSPPKPAAAQLPKAVDSQPSVPPPLPPISQDWGSFEPTQGPSSGSSLRVGRTKTSRNHFARPARPTKKFSAAYEEEADDGMDDEEELERQKQRDELEQAAKNVPTFNVPAGFSFAKGPAAAPSIVAEPDAKEPPIAALPFSFGAKAVAAPPAAPLSVPAPAEPVPRAKPVAFSFGLGPPPTTSAAPIAKEPEPDDKPSGSVPNFFGSAPTTSLLPSAIPSFGALAPSMPSLAIPTPTPASSLFGAPPPSAPAPTSLFGAPTAAPSVGLSTPTPTPSLFGPVATPVPAETTPKPEIPNFFSTPTSAAPAPVATPIRDAEKNPFLGDAAKKEAAQALFAAPKSNDGIKAEGTSLFGGATFGATPKPTSTPSFGAPAASAAGFSFGAPTAAVATPTVIEPPKVEEPAKPAFSFGVSPAASSTPAEPPKSSPFSFTTTAPVADAPKPFSFGASAAVPAPASNPFASTPATGGGFSFGQSAQEPPKTTPAAPFSFGSSSTATDTAKPASTPAPFSFGATSSAPTPTTTNSFSFGSNTTNDAKPASSGFSFGSSNTMSMTRPVTPPRNEPPEFKMDESPTREPAKPVLNGGSGFSFGASSSSGSMFGSAAPAPVTTPFAFGSPSSSNPNPFASVSSAADNKPFGSTDFGRPSSSSSASFSFGQNNTTTEAPRPSTTGSFSFGASTPTNTGFSFGASTPTSSTAPSNPFASQLGAGSAPSSPSTFNQPFSFAASSAAPQPAPFAFGSQPASPAGGLSTLPQPATPGGFGSQPSFGGGASGGGGGGGSLFTIGAAPPQQRAMKKLPRRKN